MSARPELAAGWAPPRASIADAVHAHLRESLLSGRLEPGARLTEIGLARQLDVSRTPLREALSRLVGSGLLRRLRAGGLEVADTARERREAGHIRAALEGYAARLAAARIDAATLDRLDALVAASRALPIDATADRVRVNNLFHGAARQACGLERLVQAIVGYADWFIDAEGLARFGPEESRRLTDEHAAIADALRRRDADAAERLTRAHFLDAMDGR